MVESDIAAMGRKGRWRTARNRSIPFANAEMRWPVNSPIMQNYSPRHCWNLPFRTSRATIYETPITARIEA